MKKTMVFHIQEPGVLVGKTLVFDGVHVWSLEDSEGCRHR